MPRVNAEGVEIPFVRFLTEPSVPQYDYVHWGKGWTVMNKFKEDGSDIPIARGDEKKANLAKDEQIKSYWDTLVNEWLKLRAKPPETKD